MAISWSNIDMDVDFWPASWSLPKYTMCILPPKQENKRDYRRQPSGGFVKNSNRVFFYEDLTDLRHGYYADSTSPPRPPTGNHNDDESFLTSIRWSITCSLATAGSWVSSGYRGLSRPSLATIVAAFFKREFSINKATNLPCMFGGHLYHPCRVLVNAIL